MGAERSWRSPPAPCATPSTARRSSPSSASASGSTRALLTGEEEAHLTYLGATAHRPESDSTLVFDIGGGSTELIVGSGKRGRLPRLAPGGDHPPVRAPPDHRPPGPARARGPRRRYPQPDRTRDRRPAQGRPSHAIAVAGTPTSLAAIDQELEPYDPGRVHGYHLGLKRVQRMLSRLSSLPLAERLRVPGLHPGQGSHDRRGHGDPGPGDACFRAAGDRGLRAGHPARLGALGRDGARLSRRLANQ